jgi:uncharacterized membrane protein YhaH (DUF805 family)
MGIQEAVTSCLGKYADFHGRAAIEEFWWWMLFVVACCVILREMGDFILGADSGAGAVAAALFALATFLPGLAVGARRLHDTDRASGWLLLLLLPIAGWIVLGLFCARAGTRGPNRFGDGLRLY